MIILLLWVIWIVFMILKIVGVVSWSWWFVFSPCLLSLALFIVKKFFKDNM